MSDVLESVRTFQGLGVALGLGLLVGLQRQWSGSQIAGVRTFPIVTLAGAVAALVGRELGAGTWLLAAGLIAVGAMAVTSNLILARGEHRDAGMTTEAALLAMFLVGALAATGSMSVASAVGVVIAVLLQMKARLHGLTRRIGPRDMRAIMLFAAITFVVLPVLPDRVLFAEEMGAYAVWNPRHIWLMVVLVSGVSLAGYVMYKLVDGTKGVLVAGVLGGLISSTATTVAYSRRSRDEGESSAAALMVIVLAGSIVYLRVLLSIWVVARGMFAEAAGPLLTMLGVSLSCAAVCWARVRGGGMPRQDTHSNPAELRTALVFAGLYALVLLAVAAAREWMGDRGIYAVSAISGLTDMDAITLSSARLVGQGAMAAEVAWKAILIAAISNTVFKTGVVATIGSRQLTRGMAVVAAVKIAAAVAIIVLW